jgi:hypothetical protein
LNGIIELKKEHKQDDELPYLSVVSWFTLFLIIFHNLSHLNINWTHMWKVAMELKKNKIVRNMMN